MERLSDKPDECDLWRVACIVLNLGALPPDPLLALSLDSPPVKCA